MKNKLSVVVLCIIFLLSVVGNGFVYALSQTSNAKDNDEIEKVSNVYVDNEITVVASGASFSRENPESRTIEYSGENIQLSYEQSLKLTGNRAYDSYLSDVLGECRFNSKGKLVGRSGLSAEDKKALVKSMATKKNWISEKEAIEKADHIIENEYKGNRDDFQNVECELNESMGMYYIVYSKLINGFILIDSVTVKFTALGDFSSWFEFSCGVYDDVDLHFLENIEQKEVNDYISKQINGIYGDSLTGFELKETRLSVLNNEYVLEVDASVKWLDENGVELATARTMYYEI